MRSVKLSRMRKIMKMQIQPQVVLKANPKPSMQGFAPKLCGDYAIVTVLGALGALSSI